MTWREEDARLGSEGVKVNFEILKANIDFPTQFVAVLSKIQNFISLPAYL